MKKLLTERDITDLAGQGSREILIDADTLLTPSAKDKITALGIKLVASEERVLSEPEADDYGSGKIIVGSDHAGFRLKKILIEYLGETGRDVVDIGTHNESSCDYPDFAFEVAKNVAAKNYAFGICVDATGIPSAITANKVPGIRAATCYDEFSARSAREHNNANIIVLGGKTLGEESAKSILKVWLDSKFQGERHQKRLDKIKSIEKIFLKNGDR